MHPGLRACVSSVAALGPFCRGCLSRARSWPGFGSSPRQMSRWNSQDSCSPRSAQENVRVLITGDTTFLPSLLLLVAHADAFMKGLFHSYPNTGSCLCFLPLSLTCSENRPDFSEQIPSLTSNQSASIKMKDSCYWGISVKYYRHVLQGFSSSCFHFAQQQDPH